MADGWPWSQPAVAAVIPVIDEAVAIGPLATGLRAQGVCCVIVVDGGSLDGTPAVAEGAGARVIHEPRRGYGRACLTGAAAALEAAHPHGIVVFLDGDGSCSPADLPALIAPLVDDRTRSDVALGVRTRRLVARGALPWHARLGNGVVATVLAVRTGKHPGDLPPFKAIRADALRTLQLDAEGYAWTVQFVARALRRPDLTVARRHVRFLPRAGGVSKVSGSVPASLRAGRQMLHAAVRETRRRPMLALMAKAPAPGMVKTRLAATIGDEAATDFWRACLADLGERLGRFAAAAGVDPVVVVPSDRDVHPVRDLVGPGWRPLVQSAPGLATALRDTVREAARRRAHSVVAVSGDNPTLPDGHIERALRVLGGNRRAVIGPTLDGGYHLVGLSLRRRLPWFGPVGSASLQHHLETVFPERAMGTASSLAVAKRGLLAGGFQVTQLAPWADVDTEEDLAGLARSFGTGEEAPRTARWLRGRGMGPGDSR